jgi:hypothetical protein
LRRLGGPAMLPRGIPRLVAAILLLAASSAGFIQAQEAELRNELAVTVGRTFISDQTVPNTNFFDNTVHSGKGLSFDFLYARQLKSFHWADSALAVEIPVIYNPDEDLHYGLNVIPKQYSSVFATPALRLNFVRNFVVSPWVSFGGGVGYFSASRDLEYPGTPNTGDRIKTTGGLQGGIGFDVPFPLMKVSGLKFRFEARDNWSGVPPINVDTGKTRQHNYYVGGGVMFQF